MIVARGGWVKASSITPRAPRWRLILRPTRFEPRRLVPSQAIDRRFPPIAEPAGLCTATLGPSQGRGWPTTRASTLSSRAQASCRSSQRLTLLRCGAEAIDEAIFGVAILEADPDDLTVDYPGIRIESSCVDPGTVDIRSPTVNGGHVASIRNTERPATLARLGMQRTNHRLVVGEAHRNSPGSTASPSSSCGPNNVESLGRFAGIPQHRGEPTSLAPCRSPANYSASDNHRGRLGNLPNIGGGRPPQRGRLRRIDRPGRGKPAELLHTQNRPGGSSGTAHETRRPETLETVVRPDLDPKLGGRSGPSRTRRVMRIHRDKWPIRSRLDLGLG